MTSEIPPRQPADTTASARSVPVLQTQEVIPGSYKKLSLKPCFHGAKRAGPNPEQRVQTDKTL